MKIGITTYWDSEDNYGQILQCWSLQQFLIQQGHTPFLIRYIKDEERSLSKKQIILRYIKRILICCLVIPIFYKILQKQRKDKYRDYLIRSNAKRDFASFRSQFILLSGEVYQNIEELKSNPPEADAYITGSDQVWYWDHRLPNMQAYFLQFGAHSIRRIAYAPSIGSSQYPIEKYSLLKEYLSVFDAISVRETDAVSIIKSVGYPAVKVLDPTFLLSKESYFELLPQKKPSKDYFFIYSLNYQSTSDLPWDSIQKYAILHDYRVIVTPGSGYVPCQELFRGVDYDYATVQKWLQNIAYSNLNVTASFHGVVFSILFNKRFIYTPLQGKLSASNNRVLDLLNILGLNPLIWDGSSSIEDMMAFDIDWNNVNSVIQRDRLFSRDFLMLNLQS